MIQRLPIEIVTVIAGFLPSNEIGEFAQTCQKCYYAALPHIWHQLDINNANELFKVAHNLETNGLWLLKAIKFVRQVALLSSHRKKKFSSAFVASMFGITSTSSERQNEKTVQESVKHRERIGAFGRQVVKLFPHLSNLVVDFKEATQNFYVEEETQDEDTSFLGSFSLINYKADHTKLMHNLLAPFRRAHHLKIQAAPIVSLCDDIDESILTDADIEDLATLDLKELTTLQLSYLDAEIQQDTLKRLLEGLPHLRSLELEWLFPPNREEYQQICKIMEGYGSLYPDKVEKKKSILQVHFAYHNAPMAL